MRILPIVILTLMAVHSGCGKKQGKKAKDKGPCGKPYLKELNGKCFYVGAKKINWFGAQNNCLRKGLNLADVSTVEDFNAVVHYMKSQVGFDDFWFGGNDLQSEGRFKYISNGKLVRYMGVSPIVEPTERSNLDDCLEIRVRPNVTVVLDVNCQEKKYFICEQNQLKCAVPTADSGDGQKHSHEHLHHFHHDAGKKEKQEGEAGIKEQSVESDSRPADNSNSTEIGDSEEKKTEGAPPGGDGGGTTEPLSENGLGNSGATNAEEAQTVPPGGGAGASTAAEGTGAATPAPDAAAPATGAPAEGAPAAEAATPAPAAPEGEATPAPAPPA